MIKFADGTSMARFWYNLQQKLAQKADATHTHDRVNGLKPVVSNTAPTTNDNTIITFMKPS